MDSSVVLHLRSVSPFIPVTRDYSGSAATLKEEATKAAFSSPPPGRTLSPVAYSCDLPTIGRCRASPVMVQDHFLQAAARITPVVHCRQSARPAVIRGSGTSITLRRGAVSGAPRRPKMLSPGVSLPGPFVTPSSPEPPVTTRWLLTPAGRCEVRAESSVQTRICTGRFWLCAILLSSPHPFF